MENIFRHFYNDLSENSSLTYNPGVFSIFDNIPRPIINYNDIELLKKVLELLGVYETLFLSDEDIENQSSNYVNIKSVACFGGNQGKISVIL